MRAGRSQNKRLLCTPLAERSARVGGAYFEEHPSPRALNLLLSQKDSISPIPLEPSIIIIISSSSRRAHLESAYGQSNAETWFREWKVYLQKLKKEEEKTFHCSYWFADAEATANQMGMCVCFFRNPDAWRRRRRFLWWIKKHLKRRRRRRRSPVSETLCVCACFFYPESFWDLPRETKIPDWQNCTYLTHVGPRSRGSSRFWTTPSRLSRSQRVGACIALHWPQGCQHRSVLVRIIQKLIIPPAVASRQAHASCTTSG